jgi:hypothetical protein
MKMNIDRVKQVLEAAGTPRNGANENEHFRRETNMKNGNNGNGSRVGGVERMESHAKIGSNSGAKFTRKISNSHSILELSQKEINAEDTLLGERYLCRGGGMIAAAPSGQGKSSMSFQMAALFAAGREAFGIKPAKPLRVLVIQAEDDEGDCIEMSWVVNHLDLSNEEKYRIRNNTLIVPVNSEVGDGFLNLLDCYLDVWPADIVIINPYTAYLGADEKDSEANTLFLRNGLNLILTKHKCAAIVIHHTPKTNFNSTLDYKPSDWMYRGAGAAIITNWARAYLTIDPTDVSGVFRFIAAKRGKRIGYDTWERFFKHSTIPGIMRWEEASEDEITMAKQTSKGSKVVDSDKLLKLVPVLDPEKKGILIQKGMGATGCGRDAVKAQFDILESEDKIFSRSIPNPNGGRGFAGWAKTPEPSPDSADAENSSASNPEPRRRKASKKR